MVSVQGLADAAASLVLGAACPGCGTPAARLCADCAAAVGAAEPMVVPGHDLTTSAAIPYEGRWRELVIAYKERGAWWLADPLGGLLALAVGRVLGRTPRAGAVILVPMPSQPASVRARGLDTTRALARRAARDLRRVGVPCAVEPSLRHTRRVRDQSELGNEQRRANLVGALRARPGRPGVRVVVDDLTTTGASLAEAQRALAAAGTAASGGAVVAATPLRHSR